jgi:hypothetical protein
VRILTVFLFIIFFNVDVHADSTKTYTASTVRYVSLKDLSADTLSFHIIDTSIDGKQNYNPVFRDKEPRIYLGNLGTAYHPLFFKENISTDFSVGMRSLDIYEFTPAQFKFYRTRSPFSRLTYFWNGKKEQWFDLEFAQNITPRWNYTIDFRRLSSLGDYQRLRTNHTNFYGTSWYQSLNRRYLVAFAYSFNELKNQENGGISNDSLFSVPSSIQSEFEPVHLSEAQNRWKTSSILVTQSVNLGRKDSMIVDSIKIKRVVSRHRFSHLLQYSKRRFTYIEDQIDSGYYPVLYYLDSAKTYDAIKIEEMKNEVSYDLFGDRRKSNSVFYIENFNVTGGLRTVSYRQNIIDSLINSVLLRSSLNFYLFRSLELKADVSSETFEGVDDVNISYGIALRKYFSQRNSYTQIAFHNANVRPDLIAQNFYSNHYRWKNNFKNINTGVYQLSYVNLNWDLKLSLKYTQIKNVIYYDTLAHPVQFADNIDLYGAELIKNFDFWKFHLDNVIVWQQSSENKIIRQPDLYTYNSFYFESFVFKKAMLLRVGIDSRYYTSYSGYNYNPATSQFYHDDQFKTGDYPLVDVFVNARVKRATLVLKVEHVNHQLVTEGAYQFRNYPLPDRALKIGVSWGFYD